MTEKAPSRRKPSLPANLLLALAFTALALLLADLAFRAYERHWLAPNLPEPGSDAPVNLAALRYNDGWVERSSGEGEFRILSFGDSFAYSVLEPPLSYNGVVQRALNEAEVAASVRVVNLGEPATGTRQYRLAYDYWSRALEHQGVLFMIFIGNDLLDDAYLHASVAWAPNEAVLRGGNPILDPGNPRVPRKFPLRMFDYAYAWFMSVRTRSEDPLPPGYNWAGLTDFDRETFLRINARYMENFDPQKLPALLPGYEQVLRLLQRCAELAAQGIEVAVAIGPSEAQVDDRLRAEVLEHAGREEREFDMGLPLRIIERLRELHAPAVPLIDLTPAFRAKAQRSGEGLFFRRNTHWDLAGNRVAGETLSGWLLERWFGRPGAPEPPVYEPLPENVLLDQAEIDAYLQPLSGYREAGGTRISGAARAIHLLDGIIGRDDNWAVAPLGVPVLLEFERPLDVKSLRLHLYDEDGRSYRARLEVLSGGAWHTLVDGSGPAVSGLLEAHWDGTAIGAVRITGLYSSIAEQDPANFNIHIEELEIMR